jgi:hypothetical protein
MALKYSEKDVSQWSTNDFLSYIADRHLAVYGTEYTPPGRNWSLERGLIGSLIGTKGRNPKPRKYEPEVVKAFIDTCLLEYRPTKEYPGISFWFMWTYKTNTWQKVQLSETKKKVNKERQMTYENEDLEGWL